MLDSDPEDHPGELAAQLRDLRRSRTLSSCGKQLRVVLREPRLLDLVSAAVFEADQF